MRNTTCIEGAVDRSVDGSGMGKRLAQSTGVSLVEMSDMRIWKEKKQGMRACGEGAECV